MRGYKRAQTDLDGLGDGGGRGARVARGHLRELGIEVGRVRGLGGGVGIEMRK